MILSAFEGRVGVAPGLSELEFDREVLRRFVAMPAMAAVMEGWPATSSTRPPSRCSKVSTQKGMPPDAQWLVIKEWFGHFTRDSVEVAPQSFVARRRPGTNLVRRGEYRSATR